MRYFIASDIHSFYTPFIEALEDSGFDINNPEHILVIDGDLFDRGSETLELYNYVKSLPIERRVLIRGNHEYLLRNILEKDVPSSYDYSNGTVRTCYDLYLSKYPNSSFKKKFDEQEKGDSNYLTLLYHMMDNNSIMNIKKFNNSACMIFNNERSWNQIKKGVRETGIIDWIFSDEWVDYFEMGNYVIVHSFIPYEVPMVKKWGEYFPADEPKYMPDWRECKLETYWEKASWGCPYLQFDLGYFDEEIKKGKILVCGHWHCADFHLHYEEGIQNDCAIRLSRDDYRVDINEIYFGDNLIAIDGCTIATGIVNILVIDDKNEKVYNQYKEELTKELSKSCVIRKYPKIETVTIRQEDERELELV